jgi:DNA polymerase-1
LIYGIGPNRLAKQIDVSVDEAESFMKAYFQSYPQVQDYLNNTLKQAKQNKYVETLLGRIRRLHDSLDSEDSRARSHAENIAVNTPIQGTAADLIKKAMIQIDKRLKEESFQARMLLQVHDELVFDAPEDEVERLTDMIEKEMSQAIALDVPLVVEIGKGNNWSEAH